ncbi:YbaN family protein [Thiomicrorhabdus sp. zzn3]|uniref:YbaN family protein n=1 Tax=Thiomicrorhabdus sp. zzn3 TaxID=3039775 RepID=UPI00243709D1|nr:YbaN family protein [Thiomicrorhabdus sp. zzn3]MDG6779004.1 YbaN family protein [Thiomicrorhabdus sp. zzn3]
MTQTLKRHLFLLFGVLFFITGLVGVVLPLLPTTPFMILSAACFANSSPRFHQMLLNNRWVGEDLRRWERERAMKRETKKRATWIIGVTFLVSIILIWPRWPLVILLLVIALILLAFLWRIKEVDVNAANSR